MESIRIAHISDLHFGMDNQSAVWSSLAAHLLRDPQPHGIIATGDLVDTPDPALFGETISCKFKIRAPSGALFFSREASFFHPSLALTLTKNGGALRWFLR